ncbi:MAG: NTP transferase domain-containing protein [Pseudomonadota bacterium]
MIDTAVLLAAGEGSRLREIAPSKPLCVVGGRTLLEHAIAGFAAAGMKRVVVVLGYEAEPIRLALAARDWPVEIATVMSEDYRKPNGVSVLAAEAAVGDGEALLAMCDHLVDPALYRRVADAGAQGGLTLGIDRLLEQEAVDMEDVTRVETSGDSIVAIGKGIDTFDCFDTGVFAIGLGLFEALKGFAAPSLSAGVATLAGRGRAHVVDCTGLSWIDVDDPKAHLLAERWVSAMSPA